MLGNCADTIAPWYRKISTLSTHARSRAANVDRFKNLATRGIKMLYRRLDFLKATKTYNTKRKWKANKSNGLCEGHFKHVLNESSAFCRPKWGPKGQKRFFLRPPPPLLSQGLDDRPPLPPPLIWRSGSATDLRLQSNLFLLLLNFAFKRNRVVFVWVS